MRTSSWFKAATLVAAVVLGAAYAAGAVARSSGSGHPAADSGRSSVVGPAASPASSHSGLLASWLAVMKPSIGIRSGSDQTREQDANEPDEQEANEADENEIDDQDANESPKKDDQSRDDESEQSNEGGSGESSHDASDHTHQHESDGGDTGRSGDD